MSHKAISRRVLRIVATLAATGLVAACGYKGPLSLPGGQQDSSKAQTGANASPARFPTTSPQP